MSTNSLLSTLDNGVRTIQFNRPKVKNCINHNMYNEITRILKEDAVSDSVVVTILTGTGDYFTSGNDFKTPQTAETWLDLKTLEKFIRALIDYPKLLIAVVNGPAIGVGVTLLGLCDIAYASSRATFSAPFVHLGLCAEAASTYSLPRILGRSKASELLLLGETMTAEDALRRGLVAKVVPHEDLDEFVKSLQKFGKFPSTTLMNIKKLLVAPIRDSLHKANKREMEQIEKMSLQPEFFNAMSTFLVKKKSKL